MTLKIQRSAENEDSALRQMKKLKLGTLFGSA